MNTVEIEKKTVARDNHLNNCFLGVFASGKLPEIQIFPSCFISNTDPAHKPGEHWVPIFFDKNVVEYFGCYGMEPKVEFSVYKPTVINQYCLQNIDSAVCGEYCIFYLHKRVRSLALAKIVNDLRRRANVDSFVRNYINKLRVRTEAHCGQSCICIDDNEGF